MYFWEKIRPLAPLPDSYRERYTNVQGAIGLAVLRMLDEWTRATRARAAIMNDALNGISGVRIPYVPEGAAHVYYQYCVYAPDRDALVQRALWRGIDVETLHVDVCSTLSMFGTQPPTPGAERAAQVVQLPVYASLGTSRAKSVARRVRRLLASDSASGDPQAKPRTDIAKV